MKRAAIVPAVVTVLVVLVYLRSGFVAALVLAAMAVLVLGASAYAILRIGRTQAQRLVVAKPVTRAVKHCDCCDRACLTGPICAPGSEPLVNHEQAAR